LDRCGEDYIKRSRAVPRRKSANAFSHFLAYVFSAVSDLLDLAMPRSLFHSRVEIIVATAALDGARA